MTSVTDGTKPTRISNAPVLRELLYSPRILAPNIPCRANSGICNDGCWFVLTYIGCKQAADCGHCHSPKCCILADLRRRESRKVHSRQRPSKKKRMQQNRTHHHKECVSGSPSIDLLPLEELEALLNRIISNIENFDSHSDS
jgi:hypothetical protein